MAESDRLSRDIEVAEKVLLLLQESLPKRVDIAALGVKEKLPWKILTLREALIWRIHELGRTSLECVKNKNAVAAVVLVRALLESVALLWGVRRLLDPDRSESEDELADKVDRMLLGSKKDERLPPPINVLSLIESLTKRFPGVRGQYDALSELAHPNWRGVHGSYAEIDKENFVTFYGRSSKSSQLSLETAASTLIACLDTADASYNEISDLFPEFLKSFTPL